MLLEARVVANSYYVWTHNNLLAAEPEVEAGHHTFLSFANTMQNSVTTS
jgi:hypothetical protein